MLALRNLWVYRGDIPIVRNVNSDFDMGEVHVILGKNGSGKSTLAGGIMGIYPSTGNVIFQGEDISNLSISQRAKMGITLAFQSPAEFEGIRVKDYLLVSSRSGDMDDVLRAIKIVGLRDNILDKGMDNTLSGGERKRVELASVLLMEPQVAILDEPDSGIDMLSYGNIRDAIETLKNGGASVILITHNEELLSLGDRAHLMVEGQIVRAGDPEDIKAHFESLHREVSI